MRSIYIILFAGLFCGCGIFIPLSNNTDKLSSLEIRMDKSKVSSLIGMPDEVRGSVQNTEGDIVTVWQYNLYNKSSALTNFGYGFATLTLFWWFPMPNQSQPYWLYFVKDDLAQWGRAGDWRPDLIMDVKIKNE